MKKIILILLIIGLITGLLVSCIPSVPPTPSEGSEVEEVEPTTSRVVLVELFNARGCPACVQMNPIVEEVAQEYDKSQVILIEETAWGLYSTPETSERYRWYLPESKERTTPNILFNGLNQRMHPGGSSGGGGSSNHRPIINSTPPTSATVGIEYSYQVTATDVDGDSLTYSLNTAPEGMVIKVNTGFITWTPTSTGDYDVIVEVSDNGSPVESTIQSFMIHVEEEPGPMEPIIPETTKITNEETESQLTYVSPDQSEITFAQSTPQLEELQTGDILFIGVTDQTPYGLLRKVTNITRGNRADDTLTVSTEFTSIEEAVEEIHISVNIVLTQDDIDYEKLRLPPGVSISQDRGGFGYEHTFNLSDVSPIYEGDPTTTIDDVTIDGEINLNYEMIFNLDIGLFDLNVEFRNIVESYTDLNVTVGGSLSLSDLLDPNPIHLFTIPFIPIPVAPLVVITPVIYINIGLDGEINAELTVGVTIDQTGSNRLESGFEYNNGQWHSIKNDPVFDLEPKEPELSLGGYIKPYVGPQLELIFNGCAGVYGSLYGNLELQADINDDPWWCLYGGFEGIIGAQLKILSFDLGDPIEWTIFNYREKITCADEPFINLNHPPEITSDPVTFATKDEPYSYDVNATDPDVGDTLTYSLTANPTGMNINSSTGAITWTPTTIGDYDVTVKVSDGELTDTQSFTITVGGSTKTFTITASAGPHGSISPSGDVTVNQGSDKSFTITPDTGYNIDDVLVDGSSVGTVSSYTFTNVIQDHSISATFSATATGQIHNLTKDTYYDTIQDALDDAYNNNTIEVSEGTYNENINFNGKNITLLSTNPNDPDVVASTIIDGGGNGSVVTFTGGETRQAVLRGLTIQNGNSEPGAGGGIMILNSSPTISGNIIRWNTAHSDHGGGGIFIAHSASPLIEDNTIDGNQAGFGGGIYVGDNSSPTIRNNSIENNSAGIHRGGGIFISGSSSPTIQYNSLSDNSAQYGGGICIVENSSGEITNNYFTLNTAQYGGGIFCGDSDPIIKQNEFYENSATSFGGGLFIGECVVNNNVISGNTAQTGGGIFVWESSPTISDNTINGNMTTMSGGGIYVRSNSHPTINNNIISLNTTTMDGGGLYIDGSSSVKTTNGSTWPRQNTPPNTEATNTYSDNTHGNPPDYTEGADVYMVGTITPPPDVESPTVITIKATNITETSARLYGNITNTGGENADQRGFAIHDLTEGIVLSPILEDGNFSIGEYNLTVSGLTSGHLYQFAAYAKNSHGSDSGDWIEFTADTNLVQAEITNVGSPSGDLIDPFEFDKWYDAIIYLHKSNIGTGSGTIEVKPKPDSDVIYNPTIKYFDYNDGTSGGSRGFDYKFVGSGTTRQLTFELYDQATGNKLDEYTSETLHLMQPDPHLEYIESSPSSTNLQRLHFYYFGSDYVIKAHYDDGSIETWTNYNKFLFETSNENIAYVEEHGVVGGIGPGTATITITYKQDTSKKAYLTVNVYE